MSIEKFTPGPENLDKDQEQKDTKYFRKHSASETLGKAGMAAFSGNVESTKPNDEKDIEDLNKETSENQGKPNQQEPDNSEEE